MTSGILRAARPLVFIAASSLACGQSSATTTGPDPDPTPTAPVVASVIVSPSTPSVAQGATIQVSADPRDTNGASITGRTITWSSEHPTVAQVASAGGYSATVTGVAAGSATIEATVDGVEGSTSLTVTASTAPPSLASECQSPGTGWIWCDDFDVDRITSGSNYFEYDSHSGSFVRTAGVGVDGSSAMRVRWTQGQVDAGYLHLAIGRTPSAYFDPVDGGTQDYRELYWRVYLRLQSGWVGGGAEKLSRAFIFANSNWAQAMIAHVWGGPDPADRDYLLIDPVRGTDTSGNLVTTSYNDFANFTWLGLDASNTKLFDSGHVGSWYCIEAHVKLNTAGQSDGLFELWIDDTLEAQRTGLNWVGSYSAYGLNAVYLENYWNDGSPSASPQERYIDNFVVSTARIGCG